jgi:hypothetical protein
MGEYMLQSISSLLIIILCVLGSVTASSGEEANNPPLISFTVETPTTDMWQKQSNSKHLLYGKSIGDEYSTFTIEAREYPVSPEPIESISSLLILLQTIFDKRMNNQNSGRNEMISHSEEIVKVNNLDCVKYQRRWVDHGGIATNNKELIMLATGYICIHPEFKNQLIEVNYSSRNSSGILTSEIKTEGERFINSIRAVTTVK